MRIQSVKGKGKEKQYLPGSRGEREVLAGSSYFLGGGAEGGCHLYSALNISLQGGRRKNAKGKDRRSPPQIDEEMFRQRMERSGGNGKVTGGLVRGSYERGGGGKGGKRRFTTRAENWGKGHQRRFQLEGTSWRATKRINKKYDNGEQEPVILGFLSGFSRGMGCGTNLKGTAGKGIKDTAKKKVDSSRLRGRRVSVKVRLSQIAEKKQKGKNRKGQFCAGGGRLRLGK